jgi:hypothetical protein
MSILTIIFILNIFFLILFTIKKDSNKPIQFFYYLILILFLMASQFDLSTNTGYFSAEQEGHANEAINYIYGECGVNWSIYETFKSFSMYLACKTKLEWLFDVIYRLFFVFISIYTLSQIRKLKNTLKEINLYRNVFAALSIAIIPSIIYGGPRQGLASLILITSFIAYKHNFIKGLFFSAVSSSAHSIGLLSPLLLIAMKINSKFSKLNWLNILFSLLRLIIFLSIVILLIYFLGKDFLSGESNYLFNKDANVYKLMGNGNVIDFYGIPRSFFFIPLLFIAVILFFNKEELVIGRLEGASLFSLFLMTIFLALSFISTQVAGRVIGFSVPLFTYILTATLIANKNVVKKFTGLIVLLAFSTLSFFDEYQISIHKLHDFFGLPYVFSFFEINFK